MGSLSFAALRAANKLRVGIFKNSKGEPAHSAPDGSDWCPAKWLRATMGELGELAEQRLLYEAGAIPHAKLEKEAGKEGADVAIYLDLAMQRMLDVTPVGDARITASSAQIFMRLICEMGRYANWAKKAERGDILPEDLATHLQHFTGEMTRMLWRLEVATGAERGRTEKHPNDVVSQADEHGISLGTAVIQKFNEVSKRIGVPIELHGEH